MCVNSCRGEYKFQDSFLWRYFHSIIMKCEGRLLSEDDIMDEWNMRRYLIKFWRIYEL